MPPRKPATSGDPAPRPRRPRRSEDVEALRKSEIAYRLFMGRATYPQIAATPDPDNPGKTLYADRSGAYRAVQAAIKRHTTVEESEQVRLVQTHQIGILIRSLWPHALKGQSWAHLRIREYLEHEARLHGAFAPVRSSVEVITLDMVDAEIQRLTAEIEMEAALAASDNTDLVEPPLNATVEP